MRLEDKQGRRVFVSEGYIDYGKKFVLKCYDEESNTFAVVPEAILFESQGDPFTEEDANKIIKHSIVPALTWGFDKDHRNPQSNCEFKGQEEVIEGEVLTDAQSDQANDLLIMFNDFSGYCNDVMIAGKRYVVNNVLSMIGAGKTITGSTLEMGMAIGESRPRLMIGDKVVFQTKKEKDYGVVIGLAKQVKIRRMDGETLLRQYNTVERTRQDIFVEATAKEIEPSIVENYESCFEVSKERVYRAKLKKERFVSLVFPEKNELTGVKTIEDALTCTCPVCGYRMGETDFQGEYVCNLCRSVGKVIEVCKDEIILLMEPLPSRTGVSVVEAKCCANCDRKPFRTDQAKISRIGYCPVAKQSVEACSVCKYWMPRDLDEYVFNLKRKIWQMKYKVDMATRIGREEVVFKKGDYVELLEVGKKLRTVYENFYHKFLFDIREYAKTLELQPEELTDRDFDAWKDKLNGNNQKEI